MSSPPDHSLDRLPEGERAKRAFARAEERKQAALDRAKLIAEKERALQHREDEATRARAALSKLEQRSAVVRELGGVMPASFWAAFEMAHVALHKATRAAHDAREDLAKARGGR